MAGAANSTTSFLSTPCSTHILDLRIKQAVNNQAVIVWLSTRCQSSLWTSPEHFQLNTIANSVSFSLRPQQQTCHIIFPLACHAAQSDELAIWLSNASAETAANSTSSFFCTPCSTHTPDLPKQFKFDTITDSFVSPAANVPHELSSGMPCSLV